MLCSLTRIWFQLPIGICTSMIILLFELRIELLRLLESESNITRAGFCSFERNGANCILFNSGYFMSSLKERKLFCTANLRQFYVMNHKVQAAVFWSILSFIFEILSWRKKKNRFIWVSCWWKKSITCFFNLLMHYVLYPM